MPNEALVWLHNYDARVKVRSRGRHGRIRGPRFARVLDLLVNKGLTVATVAEMMGMSRGFVYQTKRKALWTLWRSRQWAEVVCGDSHGWEFRWLHLRDECPVEARRQAAA